jgi:transcriptional regulator with GAF, ATPase, and Fis domain
MPIRQRAQQVDCRTNDNALVDSELTLRSYKNARGRVLADFERRFVTQLLSDARGNVALAARLGQMDRTYLIKLIQRHGLRSQ